MMPDRVRPAVPLTPRQEEVASHVARGLTAYAISRTLGISEKAVLFHVRRIVQRLPGDLPARAKITVWWRGGTITVLGGAPSSTPRGGAS